MFDDCCQTAPKKGADCCPPAAEKPAKDNSVNLLSATGKEDCCAGEKKSVQNCCPGCGASGGCCCSSEKKGANSKEKDLVEKGLDTLGKDFPRITNVLKKIYEEGKSLVIPPVESCCKPANGKEGCPCGCGGAGACCKPKDAKKNEKEKSLTLTPLEALDPQKEKTQKDKSSCPCGCGGSGACCGKSRERKISK